MLYLPPHLPQSHCLCWAHAQNKSSHMGVGTGASSMMTDTTSSRISRRHLSQVVLECLIIWHTLFMTHPHPDGGTAPTRILNSCLHPHRPSHHHPFRLAIARIKDTRTTRRTHLSNAVTLQVLVAGLSTLTPLTFLDVHLSMVPKRRRDSRDRAVLSSLCPRQSTWTSLC